MMIDRIVFLCPLDIAVLCEKLSGGNLLPRTLIYKGSGSKLPPDSP